jgi:membrane protease YdiL (CAAX protease family)
VNALSLRFTGKARLDAWFSALVATAVFVALVLAASALVRFLTPAVPPEAYRAHAWRLLAGSALGEGAAVGLLVLLLRARGRPLADVGMRRGATARGWLAAAAVAGLGVASILGGALHGKAPVGELSLYHLFTSLTAGLAAGFCEEIVFRGYVMSVLAEAGGGKAAQLAATAVCFGLAHAPWSHLGGSLHLAFLLGAVGNTALLGLLYGAVVLLSRRSLAPAIVAHGITDFLVEPWLILSALRGA